MVPRSLELNARGTKPLHATTRRTGCALTVSLDFVVVLKCPLHIRSADTVQGATPKRVAMAMASESIDFERGFRIRQRNASEAKPSSRYPSSRCFTVASEDGRGTAKHRHSEWSLCQLAPTRNIIMTMTHNASLTTACLAGAFEMSEASSSGHAGSMPVRRMAA